MFTLLVLCVYSFLSLFNFQLYLYKSDSSELKINSKLTWIDVRCPREYDRGHFTNAINIPIFSNKEYQELGEIYKKKGEDTASQLGYEYALNSKTRILDSVKKTKENNFIIYCARGGMRSKGFQSILDQENYKSSRLKRGYKEIREQVLNSFEEKRTVVIIAGSTGTGKTTIINKMKDNGHDIIDLEMIANHRGSAFGDLGISKQASQQQFENDLSYYWLKTDPSKHIFIESESRKIGKVSIPEGVWIQMKKGLYLKIAMKIDRRVENLIKDYGGYPKLDLERRIHQISRKLGGENAKMAIDFLKNNNLHELCKFLLENYYDKMYRVAYKKRDSKKEKIEVADETNDQIINTILTKV